MLFQYKIAYVGTSKIRVSEMRIHKIHPSAKALLGSDGIFFDRSRHVECVVGIRRGGG